MHNSCIINPSLLGVSERLSLAKVVPSAVDRAISEIILPTVERSVTIGRMTTLELVNKVSRLFELPRERCSKQSVSRGAKGPTARLCSSGMHCTAPIGYACCGGPHCPCLQPGMASCQVSHGHGGNDHEWPGVMYCQNEVRGLQSSCTICRDSCAWGQTKIRKEVLESRL